MKAEEARKITFEHSKRMQVLYEAIERSAKRGNSQCSFDTSCASKEEIEVLNSNGFEAGYTTADEDGMQYVLVKW